MRTIEEMTLKTSKTIRLSCAALLCVLLAACGPRLSQADVATATVTTMAPATPTATATPNPPPSQTTEEAAGYINITPAQLAAMLTEKDFLLVNTHTPYGYEIASTDAHIPLDDAGRWLQQYPSDKTAKIVLYCRSGIRSTITAQELMAAGYTDVWHLDGGMVAWHAAGLPLQDN